VLFSSSCKSLGESLSFNSIPGKSFIRHTPLRSIPMGLLTGQGLMMVSQKE
jgi:hypothetical protein